jgi:hypothetical protein
MAAIPLTDGVKTRDDESSVQSVLDAVTEAIGRLRFGTVQLVVHEGKVVQLDVTDRTRFR